MPRIVELPNKVLERFMESFLPDDIDKVLHLMQAILCSVRREGSGAQKMEKSIRSGLLFLGSIW